MPTLANVVVHPTVTDRSEYGYQFTPKHHGGDPKAAMWLPAISLDTEFSIFNDADAQQIADRRGWLYGVLLDDNGDLFNSMAETGHFSREIAHH
jgi:hypothetical protein